MRYQYRVTKYDPQFRDVDGSYRKPEWTAYSDIGRKYSGRTLTRQRYLATEKRYLNAMTAFLREAGIDTLKISGLETRSSPAGIAKQWKPKRLLSVAQARRFATQVFRGLIWGRLVAPGRGFVHFGYDLYMYIGVSRHTPNAIQRTVASGLYVEHLKSPYRRAV
jgi:hypothetical protein